MINWRARYDQENYNCRHFAADAWRHITGLDVNTVLQTILSPAFFKVFSQTENPVTPCICLYTRRGSAYHVGVYRNGSVLHLDDTGVQQVPHDILKLSFDSCVFFRCKML